MLKISNLKELHKFYLKLPYKSFYSAEVRVNNLQKQVFFEDSLIIEGFVFPLFSMVEGFFAGFQVRSFEGKEIRTYVKKDYRMPVIFGLDSSWQKFRYGKPLILVEGPKDAIAVKKFYPWCIAYLTSFPSVSQMIFFSWLTNNLLVIPDADVFQNSEKAKNFVAREEKYFKSHGVMVSNIELPRGDPADSFDDPELREFLKNQLSIYLVGEEDFDVEGNRFVRVE